MRSNKQPKIKKLEAFMVMKRKSYKMEESYTMVEQMDGVKYYVELANDIVTGEVQDAARDLL